MVHNISRMQFHIFVRHLIILLLVFTNPQKFNNDRMKGRYQINQGTKAMEDL
jgi:hypothetical protein